MKKKLFILVLALTLPLAFAACSKDDTTDTSSSESAESIINTTSVVSEEEKFESSAAESITSSEDTSSLFDDVYEGDGYSISIPVDFTFYDEDDGIATFTTESGSQLSITKKENADGISTMTQGQLQEEFSATYGDVTFTEYQELKIEGKSRISLMFTMDVEGKTTSVVSSIIFTDEYIYTITLTTDQADYKEVFSAMMNTFTIE